MRGPSSPTRNWTYDPCSGSREFQPLNRQGSSLEYIFFKKIPESSKKHNLNLMCTDNYITQHSYCIYICLHSTHIGHSIQNPEGKGTSGAAVLRPSLGVHRAGGEQKKREAENHKHAREASTLGEVCA